MSLQNLKDHWAYVDRFRAENQILQTQLAENRVVFIGDSIIAGWNSHSLFAENSHYINRGINGQTTSQILRRFKADVIALQPKYVLILVGTNDIAENNGPISLAEIQNNYMSMLALAEEHQIKVVFASILPASEYYWNKKISQPIEKIKVVNQFLKTLANQSNVFFVDFYTALEDNNALSAKFTADGVHPNLDGYSVMTDILQQNEFLNFQK